MKKRMKGRSAFLALAGCQGYSQHSDAANALEAAEVKHSHHRLPAFGASELKRLVHQEDAQALRLPQLSLVHLVQRHAHENDGPAKLVES